MTASSQQQWVGCPLEPYFEATAFSSEVGAAKPEPEELGMYVIRTTEHSDSDPSWAGPTVTTFAQLPGLIGQPNSRAI